MRLLQIIVIKIMHVGVINEIRLHELLGLILWLNR